MTRTGTFRRIARDALATFILFMALVALASPSNCTNCGNRFGDFLSLSAQAGEVTKDVVADLPNAAASLAMVATPPPAKATASLYHLSNRFETLLLLAAVLSALAAFNLALFRHLRRVNASPRRSEWRRG